VVKAGLDRCAKLLPNSTKQKIALDYVEHLAQQRTIQLALYDRENDFLRLPEPREALSLLESNIIADAIYWIPKVEARLPRGGIIFDVGAYRGITAQLFARAASKVYAFEAMPENAESIRRVLKLRSISNVLVHQAAVSDAIGTSDFHILESKGHNSLGKVNTSKYLYTIKVPTITLDDFTEQSKIPSIDFLKIDVEGFELEVLKGAAGLLSSKRIKMILFEANTPVLASIGRQLAPIYEFMRSHSYAITDLDGEALTVSQFTGITFGDVLAFPTA
jgi:FkbM family methyltransferase